MKVPAARLVFTEQDRADILALVDESLQSGSLTLGPHTRSLEEGFAARHDHRFAVAVASGTCALEIVLRGLGLDRGEVIVPTNTFFATAAAVLHAGGVPQFADVDATTMALSVQTVEAALTPETVGVVMVHIAGLISPEIVAVRELCSRRGLFLVEDAAHAHGSSLDGRYAGSFGVAGAFSFYPTKVLTSGEGGMLVTADERLRDEAILYRDQGKAGFLGGSHVRLGYAWRMSEFHAAVGLVHLRRLDEFLAVRRRIAGLYDAAVGKMTGIDALVVPEGCLPNYYKYIALLDHGVDRSTLRRLLAERGVSLSGEVYATPLHHEPVFADAFIRPLPVAEDLCQRHICLPIHSDMTTVEADYVIDALASALASVSASPSNMRGSGT